MRTVLHCLHIATDTLTHLIFLSGNPFAIRQQRLILAQINVNVRPFKPANRPADNLTNTIFELCENQLLLRTADVLHQGLLCILGGNSTEPRRRHLNFQLLPGNGIRFNPTGVEHRNLIVLRENFLRHHELCERFDIA